MAFLTAKTFPRPTFNKTLLTERFVGLLPEVMTQPEPEIEDDEMNHVLQVFYQIFLCGLTLVISIAYWRLIRRP